jgi:hypothetical protein
MLAILETAARLNWFRSAPIFVEFLIARQSIYEPHKFSRSLPHLEIFKPMRSSHDSIVSACTPAHLSAPDRLDHTHRMRDHPLFMSGRIQAFPAFDFYIDQIWIDSGSLRYLLLHRRQMRP